MTDANLVADGPHVVRLCRHGLFSPTESELTPLPVTRPHCLNPDLPPRTAHPAFEPASKLHQLAVVADELRQHFRADHGHMAAAMAPEPDVVTPYHGVPKGLRRPIAGGYLPPDLDAEK
jgi:hypothetical protein